MGYRSDVGITISKNGVAALKRAFADKNLDTELREKINELLSYREIHLIDPSGAELWVWSDIKWYDFDFTEIAWLMKLLETLDEEEYYYIRLGEDNDDTEIRGAFWDNPFCMGLVRQINHERPVAA